MEKLIELQSIDTKLQDLNDLLGDLPSKVDELNNQETEIQDSLIDKKSRLKDIQVKTNKNEVRIAEINDKVNKLKDQLFLVTNNKQYDALMNEVDHLKQERTKIESDSLIYIEETDNLTEAIKSMESDLGSLTADLATRREKLEAAISNSADEKLALENERVNSISQIDSSIIAVYDKVIQHRDGLAVVMILDGGCGGCGAHIPPQTVTEVKANIGVHRCDVCNRFIYSQNPIKN